MTADSPAVARTRELLKAVPWKPGEAGADDRRRSLLNRDSHETTADFYAESPILLTALLDELDAATSERDALRRIVGEVDLALSGTAPDPRWSVRGAHVAWIADQAASGRLAGLVRIMNQDARERISRERKP